MGLKNCQPVPLQIRRGYMNDFETELIETLSDQIKSGEVSIIQDNSSFFKLLRESFPLGFNRIAWNKVDHNEGLVDNKNSPGSEVKDFIQQFMVANASELNPEVTFFGDAIDLAIQLRLETFFIFADALLTIPDGHREEI